MSSDVPSVLTVMSRMVLIPGFPGSVFILSGETKVGTPSPVTFQHGVKTQTGEMVIIPGM